MNKIIFILIFFIFFKTLAISDSTFTFTFNELVFNNNSEKELFLRLQTDLNIDFLEGFLLSDTSVRKSEIDDIKSEFKNLITNINISIGGKSDEKKIKLIYSITHEKLFKQYEYKNYFLNVFKEGKFNCVSGSAIYALIFDELNIPYKIKETRIHVYLMAYPDNKKLIIESTTPSKGYIQLNEAFIKDYIQQLHDNKVVSDNEFSENSSESLFEKYYFSDSTITKKQLLGLQYFNQGIYAYEEKNFKHSFEMLKKSDFLYPSETTKSSISQAYLSYLNSLDKESIEYAHYLGFADRFYDFGVTKDQIRTEFLFMTNSLLIDKYRVNKYKNCYLSILITAKDSTVINEISFIYNYELSRIYGVRSSLDSCISYAKKALSIKPTNIDAMELLLNGIAQETKNNYNFNESISLLLRLKDDFPDIVLNHSFNKLLGTCYLLLSQQYFEENKEKAALSYLLEFEKIHNPNFSIDKQLIASVYITGGVYYFKRSQNSECKKLLNRGLEFSPNDYQIKQRLNMMN